MISRSIEAVFQEEKDLALSLEARSALSVSMNTFEKPASIAVDNPRRAANDSATLADEAVKNFIAPPTIQPRQSRIIAVAAATPEEASKDASQFTLTKPGGGGLQL
ncbi:hypothetical protein V6N11_022173 [Hibiscus sabdariffa]|uniref:Uncharacterized protein n=1 Tax=Hibiscus sabdariffa TaxID=183260 RepID=A0ABR2TJ49_9ROSI